MPYERSLSQRLVATIDREIFVLKYFRATIFRRVKFSLSGPSTKIYHRVHITATSTEELVASAFIVKFGRQLLQKYSCERATGTKDGTRCGSTVNGCIDIDGTVIAL